MDEQKKKSAALLLLGAVASFCLTMAPIFGIKILFGGVPGAIARRLRAAWRYPAAAGEGGQPT